MNTIAQDKPIYTMSKDNPVIYEAETSEEENKNRHDRFVISMYKNQIAVEKSNEENPPVQSEKSKTESGKAATILRKETE